MCSTNPCQNSEWFSSLISRYFVFAIIDENHQGCLFQKIESSRRSGLWLCMSFRLFWEKLWIWRVSTPTWSRPMFKRRVTMFWNYYLEHRILSICSMKNGTFHCDCKIGYGGDTCQLTPCSTCAAWDAIGPAGSNHETYDQRNSYCDSIGKDFIS